VKKEEKKRKKGEKKKEKLKETPLVSKLEEPYLSCLQEVEEEERKALKELRDRQKIRARESLKSLQSSLVKTVQ